MPKCEICNKPLIQDESGDYNAVILNQPLGISDYQDEYFINYFGVGFSPWKVCVSCAERLIYQIGRFFESECEDCDY